MKTNRKISWFSPTVFFAIALAFLLPFATVSCNDETVSFTGVQLAFGQVPGDIGGDSLGQQVEDTGTPWAFVAFAAAVAGLALGIAGRIGGGVAAGNGLLATLVLFYQAGTTLADVQIGAGLPLVLIGYLVVTVHHAVGWRRRRQEASGDERQTPSTRRKVVVGLLAVLSVVLAGGCGARLVGTPAEEDTAHVDFDTADYDPAWSPDGKAIAFSRGPNVMTVRPDGSCPHKLTHGGEPAWSPDGTRLAITRCDDDETCTVVVVSADGADERELVAGPFSSPIWAADGEHVYLSRMDEDYAMETWIIRSDGNGLRRLTPPWVERGDRRWSIAAATESEPTFSPDGSSYAFASSDDPTVGIDALQEAIFVRDVDGGARRQLTDPHGSGDYEPAWSADGERIAFQRSGGVAVVDADGSDERFVVSASRGGGEPSWSPDGRRLVFTRWLYGGTHYFSEPSALVVVDVDSGEERNLTWGTKPLAPCR